MALMPDAADESLAIFVVDTGLRAGISAVPVVGAPALVILDAIRDRWSARMQATATEIVAGSRARPD
jgi:hypothetical protein